MEKREYMIIPNYTKNLAPNPSFVIFTIFCCVYECSGRKSLVKKIPISNHRFLENALKELRNKLMISNGTNYLNTQEIISALKVADLKLEDQIKKYIVPQLEALLEGNKKSTKEKKDNGKRKLKKKANKEKEANNESKIVVNLINEERKRLILEAEEQMDIAFSRLEKITNEDIGSESKKKIVKKPLGEPLKKPLKKVGKGK